MSMPVDNCLARELERQENVFKRQRGKDRDRQKKIK